MHLMFLQADAGMFYQLLPKYIVFKCSTAKGVVISDKYHCNLPVNQGPVLNQIYSNRAPCQERVLRSCSSMNFWYTMWLNCWSLKLSMPFSWDWHITWSNETSIFSFCTVEPPTLWQFSKQALKFLVPAPLLTMHIH